jgi:hypothetical protein
MGNDTTVSQSVENRIKAELTHLYHRVGKLERDNRMIVEGFGALIIAVGELINRSVPVVTELGLHEVQAPDKG